MAPETPAQQAARSDAGARAAGAPLQLRINGEPHELRAPCSVAALLRRLGQDTRRIAVAVNREVVPRSAFASRELAEGDRVEILEAVGGG